MWFKWGMFLMLQQLVCINKPTYVTDLEYGMGGSVRIPVSYLADYANCK